MNPVERATRFALSGTFVLVALLLDFIARDVKFDITIHGASERVDNYAQFVGLTWIFAVMAVIAFVWSLEGIFARFARKDEHEELFVPDKEAWSETW